MEVFTLNDKKQLSQQDLQKVLALLNKGKVIVVPTDTSYGMAALINKKKAVKQVFSLKGRGKQKTSSIVVKSRSQASEYGRISCKPTRLWKAFLPGPLTLVVQSKIPKQEYIVRQGGTIAIRRIATPIVNQLLRKLSAPITITSANRSGKKDIYTLEQFCVQYKNKPKPAAFIDAGTLKKNPPSTVVAAFDTLEVFREGPISSNQIKKALNKK